MGIPLVRNNSVDDINTSIIAIKKELGKGGSGDMGDVNVNVDVKYEVTDTVEDGNSLPVTSQGVYDYVEGQGFTPVDEVEKNNMKAITSNAVANSLSYSTTEQKTGGVWIDGKMIYRKVIENPATGTALLSGVAEVIDWKFKRTYSNSQAGLTLNVYNDGNSQENGITIKILNNEVYLQEQSSYFNAVTKWAVIEYTKAD
jgi:hypothetical protein